ncbi:MAG: NADH:flavin oxidoreductase [Novosphingobium sp.]|nr:NADH:flavin oxidoreductase [Novosphingobium sp.]MCP5403700.1 NADH:flavin oxidoreductase [Novosphingobium sp.]
MSLSSLFEPLGLVRGPEWKNRFALAPLTNLQSHPDGRLSDEEYRWLTMRAEGGFGLTMTCAASVQKVGQGFPGQLGVYDDMHLEGLTRLASGIRERGSVSSMQLHHAGIRADRDIIPEPVGPSDDAETGSRGLATAEVEQLRDDFIAAALRAEQAGFEGVEVHGAHGYVLAQFLSAENNHRDDRYGGSLENRARLLMEIIYGIRAQSGPDFQLGLRLSPERFGMRLAEIKDLVAQLLGEAKIDYLDLSLWDYAKEPVEEEFRGQTLMSHFTQMDRGKVRIGAAGKVMTAQDVQAVIAGGCDFVMVGRAAILRHDFPQRVGGDAGYVSPELPVTPEYLAQEAISPAFVEYLRGFGGFVAAEGGTA